MKKTKIFALICSVVLALSAFASCAQEDNSTDPIATTTTQVTASTTAREVPPADESSEKSEDSDSSNEDSSNDNSETDSDESNITTSDAGSETESSQDESSDDVTTTSAVTTTTTTTAKTTSTTKSVEFTATSKTVYTTGYSVLRTSPSDSGTIMRYINPNEAVTVTSVSTDGKWYKVSYAGSSGYTTTQGTTTTKPTTTTTTTKKTTTTTTTAKVDPMAWLHAGGTCKYCSKKFSGSEGYNLSPAYSAAAYEKIDICNSCLNNKCLNCGKSVNSSSATKLNYNYIDKNWKSVTLCNYWLCYDCYPEGDPQYYTKLARKSEQEMLTLTQQLRKNNGRTEFYVDPQLTAWAQTRAKELATKFAHGRPNGDAGIGIISTSVYRHRGENIAKADGTVSGTALYKSLESSTGHKGTMLNTQYTAIGIGVYYDPNTGYSYTCQLFGGND